MTAPRELALENDVLSVSLLPELGGRLHRLRAFGQDLLRTPNDPAVHRADPFFWGAYPMAPWCNRAPAGETRIGDRTVRLEANFPDGTAIHGRVATRAWAVCDDGSLAIEDGGAREAWPWRYEVRLTAAIDGTTLTLRYRLRNHADEPMPAGLGLHPWFRAPIEVRLPGRSVYPSNAGSPSDPRPVDGAHDLGVLASPARDLDATWTGLDEARIELAWPDAGINAALAATTSAPSVLVALASPASLDAVAIEPQTHGPDPFRRLVAGEPDAPQLLPPGADLDLEVRLTVEHRRDAA